MIAIIKGKVLEKTPSSIIVETGGIGFEVLISGRTFEKIPGVGQDIELNIYTHVREDDLRLIGFFGVKEKELFLKLLSVSGISIKIALSALTIYDPVELKRMIMSKDSDLVRRIPGIGKKLAERIILELQDKFKEEEGLEGPLYQGIQEDDRIFEVKQALKTLGYNSKEINRALSRIKLEDIKDKKVEDILKRVLREV
ncbi:MAG: Holliday junction branch migration protein RuvA [Actinobacteria bacterium]|nr:Holliday junction branch migration protein RuvA [Actinomycetota bacterium]